MRTMIRSVLVSVLLGFLTVVAAQRTPSCEEWNTKEYFQTATVENVTACLDAGADVAAKTVDGHTPLHRAAEYNENPAIVQALLASGADLKAKVTGGNEHTPLHEAAASNKNPDVLQALLTAGADPMSRDGKGASLLRWAAINENPAVIELLLKTEIDPKASDEDGRTPLHAAASSNANPAVITTLLDAGADPNARTEYGFTPLHLAARDNENPAVIAALVDAGADLKARTGAGLTPLHLAAGFNDNLAVITTLLDAGADLEARNGFGWTPLHTAAISANPAVITALLDAGADPNARFEDGETPLHAAISSNSNPAVITTLLDAGADPNARTEDGETPWDYAKDRESLKGSDAYWRLNDARFEAPGGGAHRSPTKGQTPTSDKGNVELAAAVPSSGPGCMIAGYPSPPGGVANLGFSWCPASVTLQVRSFALQAAGAQCAIATGSSSTPAQISARRQEINAACGRLAALGAPNCQCPPGLRP